MCSRPSAWWLGGLSLQRGLLLPSSTDLPCGALSFGRPASRRSPVEASSHPLGVSVGIGTRVGKGSTLCHPVVRGKNSSTGCTSGHGICGLPRFSLRSWISVPSFMAVAAATVAITRHVVDKDEYSPRVAELQWPPRRWIPLLVSSWAGGSSRWAPFWLP